MKIPSVVNAVNYVVLFREHDQLLLHLAHSNGKLLAPPAVPTQEEVNE